MHRSSVAASCQLRCLSDMQMAFLQFLRDPGRCAQASIFIRLPTGALGCMLMLAGSGYGVYSLDGHRSGKPTWQHIKGKGSAAGEKQRLSQEQTGAEEDDCMR